MSQSAPRSFGAQLKALREAAGFTQEELATISGLSVHAVSALERGERRHPHFDTVRALSAALDLTGTARDALLASARPRAQDSIVDDPPLPVPTTVLIGREADLHVLRQWLSDPAVRLITLKGPGGAGKTRLALALAHQVAAEAVSRVLFVPLASLGEPALVAPAIAEALGLADVSAQDFIRRVRVSCGNRPTLLILDNFEHVSDASSLIAELLTQAGSLRLLVTSRAPLHVRGEREYVVGPLALDANVNSLSPAVLARSPAVRLFVERVRDVQPDFRLLPSNAAAVTSICRRLDALPLALELTAPWMRVLTPEELLRRLAQDVALPSAGPRDLPERQQTMNATMAWSYQLLNAAEQRALRHLSVMPGHFSIEAAAATLAVEEAPKGSEDALHAVGRLIEKSLLLRAEMAAGTRPLYSMLETVRAFAAAKLTASGDRDEALAGLVCYCAAESTMSAEGLFGASQAEWLDRVRDDLENYRTVLAWLIARGRSGEAAEIAWPLRVFCTIRGHVAEGLQWCEHILAAPSLPPSLEARTLVAAATMAYARDLARARTFLSRALPLAERADDEEAIMTAEYIRGFVEYVAGDLDAARHWFARSLVRFRARGLPWGIGACLNGLGLAALETGETTEAARLLDEAVEVLPAGSWWLAIALNLRGMLAVLCGQADEAIALARESVTRSREVRDNFALGYCLALLAAAVTLKGDNRWAARIFGAADAVADRTGGWPGSRVSLRIRERAEREARARLSPDQWAEAYTAGRDASIESLLTDIRPVV